MADANGNVNLIVNWGDIVEEVVQFRLLQADLQKLEAIGISITYQSHSKAWNVCFNKDLRTGYLPAPLRGTFTEVILYAFKIQSQLVRDDN